MTGFLKVLIYLSAGEIFVRMTGFPMPGPMIGLVLMLIDFYARRQADSNVAQIFDSVSKHLAILFVPAGAGVLAHGHMLSSGLWIVLVAVLVGTVTTILVTAFCFRLILSDANVNESHRREPQHMLQEVKSQ